MSTTIQSVAQQVANEITTPDSGGKLSASAAPTPGPFLQLIEQLIQMLLPMLAACIPVASDQARVVNKPRLGHRLQLAATITAHTQPTDPRVALTQAFLSVGRGLTADQLKTMQSEAAGK